MQLYHLGKKKANFHINAMGMLVYFTQRFKSWVSISCCRTQIIFSAF